VKLTSATIRRLREPGKYSDGRGLILHVITAERRNWIFRYMRQGRERMMGLGSAEAVSLDQARERAQAARALLAAGTDPIDHRRAGQQAEQAERAARTTFGEAAAAYLAAHEAGWRNPKHRQQWRNTLATYAEPRLGRLEVAEIDANHVLAVLEPIWHAKPETASRVRSRIELVLDYATARGWRSGANPAIWRGGLKSLLPAKGKVRPVEHHAALPWPEAPGFMALLRKRDGMGARALELAILSAARSGEVRNARWPEFNLDLAIWTIPAERMKARRNHRVPLSDRAVALLRAQAKLGDGSGLVFLGLKYATSMSDMTLTAVLRRMGRGELTAHGFRSTFRDWASEATHYPGEMVEMALAHAVEDKTEAAYRRGDLFEKRRQLMADWSAFLDRPPAEIVPHPALLLPKRA
jgi:integrase